MLSFFITSARDNPRTTFAGLVGALSLLGGMLATYSGGQLWPLLVGVALKGAADAVAAALAADAKAPESATKKGSAS